MAKAYGILSGNEIAEAVERQREYLRLQKEIASGGPWQRARRRRRYLKLYETPRIHIDGFDSTPSDLGGKLNPNSYNLTLADELLVYRLTKGLSLSNGQEDCVPYLDSRRPNPVESMQIPPDGMVLRPDRLYLARTREYTESHNCRPCLNGRSSVGRLGICVHITAGYGDVGFCGTWTLELMVIHPVKVYPGMGIAQIDYATINPRNHRPYMSAKYQGQTRVTPSRLFMESPKGGRGAG